MSTFEENPPRKTYYCEICQIQCMTERALQTHYAGLHHKKKERALKEEGDVAKLKKLQSDAPSPDIITSLKDYVNDPKRLEPLIGLEYVTEIRYKGRKNPFYECKQCGFITEVMPMIEHLIGQNHRRQYLLTHHPDKLKKKYANEYKFSFFKRLAEEVEKEEGLKKYKCEAHERPCLQSLKAKRKGKLSSAYQNNPIRKSNALEYMRTFEITSDTEATLVLSIAQTLSASLKKFCKKSKRLSHIRRLPSLMKLEKSNTIQASKTEPRTPASETELTNPVSETEPTNPASKTEPRKPASETEPTNQASKTEPTNQESEKESTNQAFKYVPTQPFTNYEQGNKNNWNQRNRNRNEADKNWTLGDKNWQGHLSKGIAQLKSLLEQTSSISHTPSDSYGSQISRSSQLDTSFGINAQHRATMSALQSSFALQPGNVGFGINEMMKQFNQTASVYCQSASAGKISPYFISPQGSCPPQGSHPIQHQGNGTNVPNSRMVDDRVRPWDSMKDAPDSREFPLAPISYPIPRGYQTNHPTQGFPSWLGNRSMSGNEVSASFSSEKNITGWPQQSGYQQLHFRENMGLNLPFPGNHSFSNYQQQNTQLNSLLGGTNSGLSADIMRQLHGKDVATLTAMLQQLVPHYPDLQKIDIHALARVLSEMS